MQTGVDEAGLSSAEAGSPPTKNPGAYSSSLHCSAINLNSRTRNLPVSTDTNRTIFRAQLVPAILFIALVGLTFVDKPNWTVPPPPRVWTKLEVPTDRAFVAAIESPLISQHGGYLLVNGWAAATSPGIRVTRVELYANGALLAATTDFVARPDIAANFARPDFEMSGWQCVISTKQLNAGEHVLELRLIASNGTAENMPAAKLRIVE